jgi:hypothetical protein
VSSVKIQHVFMTLVAWHLNGREAALAVWRHQGEAAAPNRAGRRQASRGSGTSTRTPVSTSGTRSRRTSNGGARKT